MSYAVALVHAHIRAYSCIYANLYFHIYTHTHTYMCIVYICIYVCVYLYACRYLNSTHTYYIRYPLTSRTCRLVLLQLLAEALAKPSKPQLLQLSEVHVTVPVITEHDVV